MPSSGITQTRQKQMGTSTAKKDSRTGSVPHKTNMEKEKEKHSLHYEHLWTTILSLPPHKLWA